jgi:hypothetical protein
MSHDPKSLVELFRRQPWLAFDRVRRVRIMPAVHPTSITSLRTRLSHVGIDGIRRSIQPELTFVGRAEPPSDAIRKWALLVDVLPRGPLDLERAWTMPFAHATLRHELGIPTLHMLIAEPTRFGEIRDAYGWEPELLPILVGSLDADADTAAVARRTLRASGYD